MRPDLWNQIPNFALSEFQQDPDRVPKEIVFPMQQLRDLSASKIFILECYAESGHADYSYHYIALAVDFYFEPGKYTPLEQYFFISMIPDFGGIGFYPNSDGTCSWHVDIRNASPKVVWFGNEDGNYIYDPLMFKEEILCQENY